MKELKLTALVALFSLVTQASANITGCGIAFLGRNQTWLPNTDFKGDGTAPAPKIPAL